LGLLATFAYLTKTGALYSRLWFLYWAIYGLLGMVGVRAAVHYFLRWAHRHDRFVRQIALVGPADAVARMRAHLKRPECAGFRAAAVFIEGASGIERSDASAQPVGPSGLAAWLQQHEDLDEVWLTWPLAAEQRVREVAKELGASLINIRWVMDIYALRLINHGITEQAGLPMIDLSVTPIVGVNRVLKEIEDKVLATLLLLLFGPLLLLAAIGVKLSSPGPVIFRQIRHGWDGKPFEVWKFRTMRADAEPVGRFVQASRNDPRVTRFGALLRRTSIDELPQFFNVLQGSMSIVGPRPHPVPLNDQFKNLIPGYLLRHRVKPGVTGWAQVHGLRGQTKTVEQMRQRVEFDLYYIEHWSLWLDLYIIARTATIVLVDRNAY